jgi:hypothetical protein
MSLLHEHSVADDDDPLGRVGITTELVMKARGRAQRDVDECTSLDPPGFRGSTRTARTIRYLREGLIPLGWTTDNTGNVAATVSPDGAIAIVVTSGNGDTGLESKTPKTKYPKGPVMHRRVRVNVQLSLFEPYLDEADEDATAARTTWLLLQYPDGNVVRAELSCPKSYDETGRPNHWSDRLILPELPIDTQEWDDPDDGNDDGVDVPVTPR